MKRILKSRRGIAIESAVIFMVVVFSLCMLITSLAMLGRHQVKIDNARIVNQYQIEEIGEQFISLLKENPDNTKAGIESGLYDKCNALGATPDVDTDGTSFSLTVERDGKVLITVVAKIEGDTVTICQWTT